MTIQTSDDMANGMLDVFETIIGTSGRLKIRSGVAPANCAAADTGTTLADIALPADFMSAAAGRSKSMLGTWADNAADNTGTAAHYRFYNSAGVCKSQGSCSLAGGGGDMILNNVSFQAGQPFSISSFTLNDNNQ